MNVLVTGARGVLGRHVMQALRDRGHDPVAAGRTSNPPMDLLHALPVIDGIDAIVHCAADPFGKAKAVEIGGLHRLRDAYPEARIVYPSIVGCDRIAFPYYKVKVAAENVLAGLGDHAILRLTQFHEFPEVLARLKVPVCPAGMVSQPIAAKEAAAALVKVLESDVQGHAGDVGGPEVHRMIDLIKEVLRDDGRRALVLRVPFGYRGFKRGLTLCPDARVGRITWKQHRLARHP